MIPILSMLLALAASPARALESDDVVAAARRAYLEGRYEDEEKSWRYLSQLGVSAYDTEANLARVLRDRGEHDAAMAQWVKASITDGSDGFAWNQRGWAYLAESRLREAREAFDKALERSSTTATQAEANLGLGATMIADAKPRAAAAPLRRAGISGPYAISASALLTAEAALDDGDRQTALTYLRQALELDAGNAEALRGLARLLDKAGDNRAAWRALRRVLTLDPADEQARKAFARNARYMTGDLDAASGVRRVSRPALDPDGTEPALPVSARPIRVGLYGAPDGRPATMTRAYVMVNSPFKVTSVSHGVLRDNGRAQDQWEVSFRPENGLVEVRDASRNILFVSKRPFAFAPDAKRGSTLIKSAVITDSVGVDLGDREVRGSVEVIPNPWGFKLVQVAPLEQYLYGVVSFALPEGSPPQAYRAQAVVSRTAAVWAIENRAGNLEEADLLDDGSLQRTIGVSGELRAAAEAVLDTEPVILTLDGKAVKIPQHEDSGGTTEDGRASGEPGVEHLVSVQDSEIPRAPWRTPADLERFTHEAPPGGLFSEAAAVAVPAAARWIRFIEAKEIRERVARRRDVGPLLRLRVLGRTETGRVKAIEVVGTRGTQTYTGRKEIEELLSPGSLRSTMFTLQPLMDGKSIRRVVLWGAGTGSGLGFPRAGAMGQASLGREWKQILSFYFPKLKIRDPRKPEAKAIPAAVGPYKRTLNFRDKDKKK